MKIGLILIVICLVGVVIVLFLNQPSFGRLPRGKRLERISHSPNYRNGEFSNQHKTEFITSQKGRIGVTLDFLFRENKDLRPQENLPAIKTNLRAIPRNRDVLVWFGHSSYFIQIDGKRILADPVFCKASPVSFVNRPFKGTDIYRAEDMPEVDYLVISHDHWDHLDYQTVKELKNRIGQVICPLGVGEHFEYWGFDPERIIELDWEESAALASGFRVHCLPARHFSGRGITSNQSLWASFLIEAPSQKIYLGGDGGYDTHFADIGKRFPDIDLAILENGQYNEDWQYIHLMPSYLEQTAKDLKAKTILTVHHSKYALAKHPWNEPRANAVKLAQSDSFQVLLPVIGEIVTIKDDAKTKADIVY